MTGGRRALLIATFACEDPRWNALAAPLRDAGELAAVLSAPGIGRYEVAQVLDQPVHLVQPALLGFFTQAALEDELFVYFFEHGIKDIRTSRTSGRQRHQGLRRVAVLRGH
ncbi:hypothetical protein AAW14_37000 [Streptomyces hygroscopicus]|uniref:hypothetical protein n=1 Tax=Streptomyces hygroscopicus TaxID=1912 RepID=UPI0022407066|nr:hypothetical protein [Streptomyces hygroscopicus]MCW7947387.1 hypothetical protein [Streptomyces hygroscopicus]